MFERYVSAGLLAASLLLPDLSSAARTGNTACDSLIATGLQDRVLVATDDSYEERISSYYSLSSQQHPWCIVMPQTADEVSKALTALIAAGSGAGDWHIAVRGGGHNHFPNTNNIANGVTIDLGAFNTTTYDATTNLASLGPGSRWKDVYADLLKDGVCVPGGRDGGVGVGGFLLGGGNSYYAGAHGFGCDAVRNFEVVLTDGSIVNANNETNPDLYKALKGGGANFGIVTRFDLEAFPAVDLYGGMRFMNKNQSDALVDTVVNFAGLDESAASDAMVALWIHNTAYSDDILIGGSFVNVKGQKNSSSFTELMQIPSVLSSLSTMSMADYAAASTTPTGWRNVWFTLTFLANPIVMKLAATLHEEFVNSMLKLMAAEDLTTQMVMQPLPTYFSELGPRNGGNVLGMDTWLTQPSIMYLMQVRVNGDESLEAIAHARASAMAAEIEDLAISLDANVPWRYLNYADPSQDPLGSLGSANVEFVREVAAKYDPSGVMQTRIPGGFKISRVQDSNATVTARNLLVRT